MALSSSCDSSLEAKGPNEVYLRGKRFRAVYDGRDETPSQNPTEEFVRNPVIVQVNTLRLDPAPHT